MTLCVAAACREGRKSRIVIATDWRAENYIAGADIQDKLYWVGGNVAVLIASNVSRAVELRDTFSQLFERREKSGKQTNASNVIDVFKTPPIVYKKKLINEYVGLKFGISYKGFLDAVEKGRIPVLVAEDTFADIAKIRPGCCLILAFFLNQRPYIFKIEDDGSLENCDNFASIGSGSYIADAALFQREHEADLPISSALYHVFEAMKLGSIAPGVGKEHTINVLYPQGEKGKEVYGEVLTHKGIRFMERQFNRVGPKNFLKIPKLPNGCLEKDFS